MHTCRVALKKHGTFAAKKHVKLSTYLRINLPCTGPAAPAAPPCCVGRSRYSRVCQPNHTSSARVPGIQGAGYLMRLEARCVGLSGGDLCELQLAFGRFPWIHPSGREAAMSPEVI